VSLFILSLHGKLSSESRFTTGVSNSGRAEEEISGGDDDGHEASPDGVLGEARAEGSTPADRPMGELSAKDILLQRLLESLEWTENPDVRDVLQCPWRRDVGS
jgi:hypothetical protein